MTRLHDRLPTARVARLTAVADASLDTCIMVLGPQVFESESVESAASVSYDGSGRPARADYEHPSTT